MSAALFFARVVDGSSKPISRFLKKPRNLCNREREKSSFSELPSLYLDISVRIGNITLKFSPSSQPLPSGGRKMREEIRSIYDSKQEIDQKHFT